MILLIASCGTAGRRCPPADDQQLQSGVGGGVDVRADQRLAAAAVGDQQHDRRAQAADRQRPAVATGQHHVRQQPAGPAVGDRWMGQRHGFGDLRRARQHGDQQAGEGCDDDQHQDKQRTRQAVPFPTPGTQQPAPSAAARRCERSSARTSAASSASALASSGMTRSAHSGGRSGSSSCRSLEWS
ncbi:hypothetical protein [Fodinicola feengrottensis]|uniref:hypothetical protein n=1 Tax=Fodinicola feengrottensis TaxID=435914 RepID=UPI0013D68A90|nr:hypothetical protein [Fodinicola feengrottensis]